MMDSVSKRPIAKDMKFNESHTEGTDENRIVDMNKMKNLMEDIKSNLIKEIELKLKDTNESLKLSESRFKDMARLLPETVFEASMNLQIRYLNDKGKMKFKIPSKEIGKNIFLNDLITAKDIFKLKSYIKKILDGEEISSLKCTALSGSLSTFPAEIHFAVSWAYGHREEKLFPTGIIGIIIDISDRKKAEQTREFIISLLSRDIRNYDKAITNNVQMLLSGVFGDIESAQKEVLERILFQSIGLNKLISNAQMIVKTQNAMVNRPFRNRE